MLEPAEVADLLASDRYTRKTLEDGSSVLLDVEAMRVLSLNATGTFVLEEIVGGAGDVATLADRLAESFEVDRETAALDVRELLEELERVLSGANET